MLTKSQIILAIQKSLIEYKKTVLDGLYSNQNAFSNIKVGNTTVAADSATSTLTLTAGNNVSISANSATDSVTISATDTKYSATAPISLNGTSLSHATSGATAGSYGDSANQTPAYGGTFKVPYVTVNNTGHVTEISQHTVKIPASDNTDSKMNVSLDTASKAYLVGVTTAPTSTAQGLTGVADTGVYLDTEVGQLTATKFKGDLVGNASSADKVNKQLNIVMRAIQGGDRTVYDGSSAQTVVINPGIIGAAYEDHTHNYAGSDSASGAANSAKKLTTARKIGFANFDGSTNIGIHSIFGEINTTSSGSTNKNKWTKIASIDVSGIAYKTATGKIMIDSAETHNCSGILYYYFRLNAGKTATSVVLNWLALDNVDYAKCVAAVKTDVGKYDIYFKPLADWNTMHITFYTNKPELLTTYVSQGYVDTIEPEVLSNFNRDNSCVNVRSFGAKGNGTTDDTQAFRDAIAYAYSMSFTMKSSTWKNGATVYVPSGSYKITETIIDSDLDVSGLRFVFKGESYQNTEIYFAPGADKYLLDNQGIFGRSIFKDISFVSDNQGSFMNLVGGTTGNAQSISFENCYFGKFKTIITSIYESTKTMGSEITFLNCKMIDFDKDSVLFQLGNSQAINWRFIATDIESYNGIVFEYAQGQNISIYQGSFIGLNDSTFINITSTSNADTFGQGNAPHMNMLCSRFELRNNSKLYDCNNPEVKFSMNLVSCGMGGANKTSFTDSKSNKVYVMNNIGRGRFIFDNCTNWGNYWIHSHKIYNSNGYLEDNVAYIEFRNSCPLYSTLNNNLVITEATNGSYYNIGANPNYNFVNCGINALIKLPLNNYTSKTGGYLYSNNAFKNINKKIVTLGCANNGLTVSGISATNPSFSKTISLPEGIALFSIKLIIEPAWTGGYPSNEFDVSITNADGSFEFVKDSYVSKDGIVLTSDEFYRIKDSDNIKITWTATKNISASYSCIAHVILEY